MKNMKPISVNSPDKKMLKRDFQESYENIRFLKDHSPLKKLKNRIERSLLSGSMGLVHFIINLTVTGGRNDI
jgi:hypothetical protein